MRDISQVMLLSMLSRILPPCLTQLFQYETFADPSTYRFAGNDDIVLCAIVILRVFEQLNGEPERYPKAGT